MTCSGDGMTGSAAFARVVDEVRIARQSLGLREHQECFFRGHGDVAYKLLPSLYRQGTKSFDEYWKLERRVFFEFRARARQLYENEHTDWDILFHMQHHGLPTRLLDWTSTFGVAVYFATLEHDEASIRSPCVWMLNPFALNKATWNLHRLFDPKYLAREESANRSYEYGELLLGTHPHDWGERLLWETPLAIYTHQRSERMFAQCGWFTIHGLDQRPLEDTFGDRSTILRKIEIPQSAIPGAREFLALAGIDHRTMFPDLDGLARSVSDRFGLKR